MLYCVCSSRRLPPSGRVGEGLARRLRHKKIPAAWMAARRFDKVTLTLGVELSRRYHFGSQDWFAESSSQKQRAAIEAAR